MSGDGPLKPGKHKRRTEARLVLGGFAIILVMGGALMWRIYGQEFALVGLGVMVGVLLLFAVLWFVLKAAEDWAKSE